MDRDAQIMRDSITSPQRFGEIFTMHHAAIWRYIARLAGPDVADDIAGEVFVDAFTHRESFDPLRGRVRSWLFGIATNKLHSRFRSESRAASAFCRAAQFRDTSIDFSQMVVDADDLGQQVQLVRNAIEYMERNDREVLALAVWEGMPYQEIALTLGVPVGTVRSRLSRARSRLRELVATSGQLQAQLCQDRSL